MATERRLNQLTISDFAEGSALPEIRLHSGSCTSERVFALRRPAHIIVIELSSDEAIVHATLGRLWQSRSLAAQYSNVQASPWPRDGGPLTE